MSLVDSESNTDLWLAYSARRMAAVAIDGFILAAINLAVYNHFCGSSISAQPIGSYSVQLQSLQIAMTKNTIACLWASLAFFDSFAVFPGLLGIRVGSMLPSEGPGVAAILAAFYWMAIGNFVYHYLAECVVRCTLGKLLMSLEVAAGAGPLAWLLLLFRYFSKPITVCIYLLALPIFIVLQIFTRLGLKSLLKSPVTSFINQVCGVSSLSWLHDGLSHTKVKRVKVMY